MHYLDKKKYEKIESAKGVATDIVMWKMWG